MISQFASQYERVECASDDFQFRCSGKSKLVSVDRKRTGDQLSTTTKCLKLEKVNTQKNILCIQGLIALFVYPYLPFCGILK